MPLKCNSIFFSWRSLSSRTVRISKKLGICRIHIKDKPPYIFAVLRTIYWILKLRPKNIFIQLPQGPLLLVASLLKLVRKCRLFADVHVGFLIPITFKEKILNGPFRGLLRFCDIYFVHSYQIKSVIKDDYIRRKALVLTDPLPELPPKSDNPEKELGLPIPQNKVKFIYLGSLAHDEPIEILVHAFKKASNNKAILYITGNWKKRRPNLIKLTADSKNIILTGFLPWEKCMKLMMASDVVIGLTSRGFAVMAAAIEGMAADKPLILSDIPAIKEVFTGGAILVNPNSVTDLARAIRTLLDPDKRECLINELRRIKKNYQKQVDKAFQIIRKAMIH